MLYTEVEPDMRKSGEKQFDYVDPRNRAVQIEMEIACTSHLKDVKAFLKPVFKKIEFEEGKFDNEASVIIPVRNRVRTLGDAISSVLTQKAGFKFNLIVIDNHSTDGTGELIQSFASKDERVVHLIPERKDLGIGGCWNEGVFHHSCGKFAIQLDSDDLYIDDNVVARIVEAFYKQQCAMVVGSYKMVNFNLEDIPPGLIDHKEWTPENGRNNALRINGLGAPRAFYTPVLRTIRVPNVSYGEDYAVGLAISRHYQIGRIMDPLYLCRRWDENSDASLDVTKMNSHNLYKDKIRTIEFIARKRLIANNAAE
jgi:glycosyltransferase involved in cell wall biosynthesis